MYLLDEFIILSYDLVLTLLNGPLSIFVRIEIWRLLAASKKLLHVFVMRFDFLIVISQLYQLFIHILFVKCEFLMESTHVYQNILHKPFNFIFDIFDNFGFELLNLRLKLIHLNSDWIIKSSYIIWFF